MVWFVVGKLELADMRDLYRQSHGESSSLSRSARYIHISAEQVGESLCDSESEAGAGCTARCFLLHLPEGIEYPVDVFLLNSNSGIGDLQQEFSPKEVRFCGHTSSVRELHRIGEEVHQDLPDLCCIALDNRA